MAFTEAGLIALILGVVFLLVGIVATAIGLKMSGKKSGKWPLTVLGIVLVILMIVGVILPAGGLIKMGYASSWIKTETGTPDPTVPLYEGTLNYIWAEQEDAVTRAKINTDLTGGWFIMDQEKTKKAGFDYLGADVMPDYPISWDAVGETGGSPQYSIRVRTVQTGAKLEAIYQNSGTTLVDGDYYNTVIPFEPEPEFAASPNYIPTKKVAATKNPWLLARVSEPTWSTAYTTAPADFNGTTVEYFNTISFTVATDGRQVGALAPYQKPRLYIWDMETDSSVAMTYTTLHKWAQGGLNGAGGWKLDNELDLRYVEFNPIKKQLSRSINERVSADLYWALPAGFEDGKAITWTYRIIMWTSSDVDVRQDAFGGAGAWQTTQTLTDGA